LADRTRLVEVKGHGPSLQEELGKAKVELVLVDCVQVV
jgi:hypothetical protein